MPDVLTVVGTWRYADGTPATGSVEFRPSVPVQESVEDVFLPDKTIRTRLDDTGSISVRLYATDDPDWSPSGWVYRVTENISGAKSRSYYMEVPRDTPGGVLNLIDIAPIAKPEDVVRLVLLETYNAHVAGTADQHTAANIGFTPADTIASTNVQGAVVEALTDARAHTDAHVGDDAAHTSAIELAAHEADTTAVHGITDTALVAFLNAAQTFTDQQTVQRGLPADDAVSVRIAGEAEPRFVIDADGTLRWGPGNAPLDASFRRVGPDRFDFGYGVNYPVLTANYVLGLRAGQGGSVQLQTSNGTTLVQATEGGTSVAPPGAGNTALFVTGVASQTADLLVVRDSAGTPLSRFDSGGRLHVDTVDNDSGITLHGGASTDPGNSRLLRFKYSDASWETGAIGLEGNYYTALGFYSGSGGTLDRRMLLSWNGVLHLNNCPISELAAPIRLNTRGDVPVGVEVTAGGPTPPVFGIKLAASQTGDAFRVTDSAGAVQAYVTPAGAAKFGSGSGGIRLTGGQPSSLQWGDGTGWIFTIGNPSAPHLRFTDNAGIEFLKTLQVGPTGTTAMIVQNGTGAGGSVAIIKQGQGAVGDFVSYQDDAGTVLASLTNAGLHRWVAGNEQTAVGAAGAAAALPAAPTKYLKVVDSTGATLVVPAYAAA